MHLNRFENFWFISLQSIKGVYPYGLEAFAFLFLWAIVKWSLIKHMSKWKLNPNLRKLSNKCQYSQLSNSVTLTESTRQYAILKIAWMYVLFSVTAYLATRESVGVLTRIIIGCETVRSRSKKSSIRNE